MESSYLPENAEMNNVAAYAEVNAPHEGFEMDIKKCYSNVKTTSTSKIEKEKEGKRNCSKKQERCSVTISVFVVVMMMVLVTTCACVIIALLQIAALQQTMTSFTDVLMMSRQNFSSEVQELGESSHN